MRNLIDQEKSETNEVQVIVINACKSELIAAELEKIFKTAAIIAIEKKKEISDTSAKLFTKYFYWYLFAYAG